MLKVLSSILLFSVSEFKGMLRLSSYSSCVKLIFSCVKITYIYIYFLISTPLLLISFQSIHTQGQCFLNAHFILAFLAPFNSS